MTTPNGPRLHLVRSIAEADPDPEARRLAADLLTEIPEPAGTSRGGSSTAAAETLAGTVRSRFLLRTGFPARLDALAGLSDADARALTSDLLDAALGPLGPGDSRERRTERLHRVMTAVRFGRRGRPRGPAVHAALPDEFHDAVQTADPETRVWLGGLLGMVEPAEIVGLAEPLLAMGSALDVLPLVREIVAAMALPEVPAEHLGELLGELVGPTRPPDAPVQPETRGPA